MRITVSDAKTRLAELVNLAEAGEEVILTRDGHAIVRLVPMRMVPDRENRRAILEAARKNGAAKMKSGPSAARSQDFLYGEDGLPK
jgi:prevent-host-death family protein